MKLRVVLEYDNVVKSWAAYCPEVDGLNSCGFSKEEALNNFKEAAELFFEPSEFPIPSESEVIEMII